MHSNTQKDAYLRKIANLLDGFESRTRCFSEHGGAGTAGER